LVWAGVRAHAHAKPCWSEVPSGMFFQSSITVRNPKLIVGGRENHFFALKAVDGITTFKCLLKKIYIIRDPMNMIKNTVAHDLRLLSKSQSTRSFLSLTSGIISKSLYGGLYSTLCFCKDHSKRICKVRIL